MARKRSISVRALNIRLHEHSPERYSRLIKALFNLKRATNVRADTYFLLFGIGRTNSIGEGVELGSIAKFTEIDRAGKWFNLENMAEASDEDLQQVSIPANLRANFNNFFFAFDPYRHLLVFESDSGSSSLSPALLQKHFQELVLADEIRQEFGNIEIDICLDANEVSTVFDIEVLKKLKIVVSRPNPDGVDRSLAEKIRDRLAERNASKETYELTAAPGKSIDIDDDLIEYAGVAALNGDVEAEGRDANGAKDFRSLKKFPLFKTEKYDPDTETNETAFSRAALFVLKSIMP